jgi:VWFA-related protein
MNNDGVPEGWVMRQSRSLGFLLNILLTLTTNNSWAQSPNARINAPGGNPRDLPQAPEVHHATEEGRVVFRTQTVLIQVPVVVTDKSGTHVHGLPKDQFQVFENGKEQKITTFEEIIAKNTPIPPAAIVPGVFSNLPIPADQSRSVAIVAIDMLNTPFLDQVYGRQQLIKYLGENLDSGQATALVLFDGNGVRVLHGLTTDTSSLIKIVKEVGGQLPALHGVNPDTRDNMVGSLLLPTSPTSTIDSLNSFIDGGSTYASMVQQDAVLATMRAFMIIAETLSGIPGRKSLIWATGSFPFYMNSPDTSPLNAPLLAQSYERAVAALNRAQISVYPVDVRGLVPSDVSASRGPGIMSGPAYANFLTARGQTLASRFEAMQNFAETTGGRAFHNTNDLSGAFKRAADDGSSYYLLGYYLDTQNNRAGWRKLKVKVLQKDTEVRARYGFLMTSATMNPDTTRDADLKFAINSPFDATGIPVTVRWRQGPASASQKGGDKKVVTFTLQIPGKDLTTVGVENQIDVDILAIARNDALVADNVAQNLKGAMAPEKFAQLKSKGVDYAGDLHLTPGNYLVRFVVRDNQSGRMGSVTAPLAVE